MTKRDYAERVVEKIEEARNKILDFEPKRQCDRFDDLRIDVDRTLRNAALEVATWSEKEETMEIPELLKDQKLTGGVTAVLALHPNDWKWASTQVEVSGECCALIMKDVRGVRGIRIEPSNLFVELGGLDDATTVHEIGLIRHRLWQKVSDHIARRKEAMEVTAAARPVQSPG